MKLPELEGLRLLPMSYSFAWPWVVEDLKEIIF